MVKNMDKKQKQVYSAPVVELIEARVEKGFQNSATDGLRGIGTEEVGNSGNNYNNTLFT